MGRLRSLGTALSSSQWLPYVLAGLGLLLGLVVLLLEPLPWSPVNLIVGGALLGSQPAA